MGRVTIRYDDEQEAELRKRMVKTGETNISAYIRAISTTEHRGPDPAIAVLSRQVGMLSDSLDEMRKLLRHLAAPVADEVELKMLAGVYLLLYQSVDSTVRASIDPYLDYRAVKGFLEGRPAHVAPSAAQPATPRSRK
jgi:hypothetical protein